jgi:dTDP-4-amino-4,6-dideoxygalactose transaminase
VVAPDPVPRAEAWAAEELSLPMSPALTAAEIERAARACVAAAAPVRRREAAHV